MAVGAVLLIRARRTVDALAGAGGPGSTGEPSRTTVLAARALGLRDLVQGGLLVLRPRARLVRLGSAVDALHAASMVALVLADRQHRRIGSAAAAAAGAELLADRAVARRTP
jgi:hypothetical protein